MVEWSLLSGIRMALSDGTTSKMQINHTWKLPSCSCLWAGTQYQRILDRIKSCPFEQILFQ